MEIPHSVIGLCKKLFGPSNCPKRRSGGKAIYIIFKVAATPMCLRCVLKSKKENVHHRIVALHSGDLAGISQNICIY